MNIPTYLALVFGAVILTSSCSERSKTSDPSAVQVVETYANLEAAEQQIRMNFEKGWRVEEIEAMSQGAGRRSVIVVFVKSDAPDR